ncbi:MAG: CHAT domain-containing protein [Bryobacteraceae bacterium]|nr:CHAT domain-containing protein [Bryobacteraceae bacterium]
MRQRASSAEVERLYAEVMRLTSTDLKRAGEVAQRTRRLAGELADARLMGLAERALGHVNYLRSRHQAAVDCYENALAHFREAQSRLDEALTQSGAVVALVYLARYEQAGQWSEEARRYFVETNDSVRLARLEGNMAAALFRQDRYLEAYSLYERALHVLWETGRPVDVATALRNMATCLISVGDFSAAAAAHQRAREFCQRHDLPLLVAGVDYNVAYLHYMCGDYADAMQLYAAARKSGEPYRVALCDLDEAEMYLELNLHSEAGQLAERAVRQFRRLRMPYEEAKACVFFAIAEGQSGRFWSALRWMKRASLIFEREQNQVWLALIDLYNAILRDRVGDVARARRLCARAFEFFAGSPFSGKAAAAELLLARLELRQGRLRAARERCQSARRRVGEIGSGSLEWQSAQLSGEIAEAQGDQQGAQREYLVAYARLEGLRYRLRGDEMRIAFLKDKLWVYESLFWLDVQSGEPERMRKAFELAGQAKSRTMAEAIRSRTRADWNRLPDPAARDLDAKRQQLDILYQRIDRQETAVRPQAEDPLPGLRAQARELEREFATTLASLNALHSRSVDAAGASGEQIRALLDGETHVVEYFEARGTLFAFLLDRGEFRIFPLSASSEIEKLLRFLRFQMLQGREGGNAGAHVRRHLQALYGELVAPIRPLLKGSHLVIIPHGALHGLPFQALFDGEQYLIDRYSISYAPSAEVFRWSTQTRESPNLTSLVVGLPDERAPHIGEEVRRVASILPASRTSLGADATVAMLRESARTARFVHIATHGYFHRDNPLFSSIRLGDARLTVYDLSRLEMPAELVTLSGCSTGMTDVAGADELAGLLRGVFQAGARSALVSLWDVHDHSTAHLMTGFYTNLIEGRMTKAGALRQASLDLRRSFPDPFHWAPFCLVGNFGGIG